MNEYVFKNIFIATFLLIIMTWSLSNENNIFKKITSIKFLRTNILFYGLWHSWNMFVDPYRVNSIFYVNIHFKDNKEIIQEVFNPYKGRFLDKKICIRDVKFIENILDKTNNINTSFLKYLTRYFTVKFGKTIDQIYLVQEYGVVSDFYLRKNIPTKTKFLYGWPNNDIDKFNN